MDGHLKNVKQGRSRDFSKGRSHCVKVRVLTRCRFRHLLLTKSLQKAYQRGGGGGVTGTAVSLPSNVPLKGTSAVKVGLELITIIMPRLQIKLLNKKNAISNYDKWKRLSLLIFRALPSWILWRHCIALLFQTKESHLSNNRGNAVTSWNPRWRRAGNLKAEISSVYYYY